MSTLSFSNSVQGVKSNIAILLSLQFNPVNLGQGLKFNSLMLLPKQDKTVRDESPVKSNEIKEEFTQANSLSATQPFTLKFFNFLLLSQFTDVKALHPSKLSETKFSRSEKYAYESFSQ